MIAIGLLVIYCLANQLCVFKAQFTLEKSEIHATADLLVYAVVFVWSILPSSLLGYLAMARYKVLTVGLPSVLFLRMVTATISLIYMIMISFYQVCTDGIDISKLWKFLLFLGTGRFVPI